MGKKYRQPTYVRDRQCGICGCFFTPQGLSGHMRYAHQDLQASEEHKQLRELQERKKSVLAFAQGLGASGEEIAQAKLWIQDWQRMLIRSHMFQIRLTEADFKSYIMKRLMDEG